MKSLVIFMLALGLSFMANAEGTWSVGEAKIKGKPVVYKFTNEHVKDICWNSKDQRAYRTDIPDSLKLNLLD